MYLTIGVTPFVISTIDIDPHPTNLIGNAFSTVKSSMDFPVYLNQ